MSNIVPFKESNIIDLLKPKMNDLIRMIGEDRLNKEASFALQAINSNSLLMKATQTNEGRTSIAKAIFNLALTGLSLNPISKLAYITPRWIDGTQQAILMPSYQGLVKLIADTGSVKSVYAYPVYEGDEYEESYGTHVEITHKPKRKSKKITHVYAVAILPDYCPKCKEGTILVESMSAEDVYDIRARSDSYKAYLKDNTKNCIWITDEGEMFRKTVIKRITKYIPKTDRWERINEAIDIDNSDFSATPLQEDYIASLLRTCSYDQDTRDIIMGKVEAGITNSEAMTIINDLKENQLEPVSSGLNYNQTEAKEKLKQKTNENE